MKPRPRGSSRIRSSRSPGPCGGNRLDRPPLSTELLSAGVFAGVLLPYPAASLAPLLVRLSRACRDSESRDQQGYADRQYAAHWQSMFQRRQIIRTKDLRQRRPGELSSPGRPRFTVDTPIHVSLPTKSYSKILGAFYLKGESHLALGRAAVGVAIISGGADVDVTAENNPTVQTFRACCASAASGAARTLRPKVPRNVRRSIIGSPLGRQPRGRGSTGKGW